MEQALTNILEKLQKLHQVKSAHHDHVQEELAIRRTASKVAHEKDVSKIAKMDKDELKKFLDAASIDSDMSAESVMIASSVINMATHPKVKTGKRYLDAVATIDKAKEAAASYEELKSGLIDDNLKVEEELKLISNLSSSIVDGQLVDTDIYIPFFKELLYPDDISNCLVAVTAIVRKNAELIENGEIDEELPYRLFPEQAQKVEQYEVAIKGYALNYIDKKVDTSDTLYLENILGLLEKDKVSLEEARKLLTSYPGMYEYLLFRWMEILLKKIKGSSSLFNLLEMMERLEKIDKIYQDIIKKEESNKALSASLEKPIPKTLIYNAWVDPRVPTFAYQNVNSDSLALLDQLRQGKDSNNLDNITSYEGNVGVITGEKTFVLFRKFPKDNTFIVTSDSLDRKDKIVTRELLALIAKSYSEMNNWILTDSSEYSSMLAITKQVEDYWKSNLKGDK